MNTSTNDNHVPYVVAIVCMGPSHQDYVNECLSQSSRWKVADETWCINAACGVLNHDRAFIMDDLRYFQKQARTAKHLEGYQDWLSKLSAPIYTSTAYPEFPSSVDFPIQEVVRELGYAYFNTTVAYAVAYAIYIRVREIRIYGADFTSSDNKAFNEAGRACVEFWLGRATLMGIKVYIAGRSSLCDQSAGRVLYGYSVPPAL